MSEKIRSNVNFFDYNRNRGAAHEVEKGLPKFWDDFQSRCSPDERRICGFVADQDKLFDHDGSLAQITQSLHAVIFNNCSEMGIETPHDELALRIRQEFG